MCDSSCNHAGWFVFTSVPSRPSVSVSLAVSLSVSVSSAVSLSVSVSLAVNPSVSVSSVVSLSVSVSSAVNPRGATITVTTVNVFPSSSSSPVCILHVSWNISNLSFLNVPQAYRPSPITVSTQTAPTTADREFK